MTDPLASVALAVSSFRSDEAILSLLRSVFAQGRSPFHTVIVVDSLGSGAIEQEISARNWPVRYVNADTNLGSAGNLALRLKISASTEARWCYAVNHDGVVDFDQVRKLVAHGASRADMGAVYPTLVFSRRGNSVETPRRSLTTRSEFKPGVGSPDQLCEEVSWSSSNCALYALEPFRKDVEVWADLWMGWEDLALGWFLQDRGWAQIQCKDVMVVDSYEYDEVKILGRKVYVPVKPSWYAYYQIRNLFLIRQRSNGAACSRSEILRRTIRSLVGLALLSRPGRTTWLRHFGSGFVDGLRGKAGKGAIP